MQTDETKMILEYHDNGQLKTEEYWFGDQLHNLNGPAIRYWDENGKLKSEEYFILDEQLTKEEFKGLR